MVIKVFQSKLNEQKIRFYSELFMLFAFNFAHTEHMKIILCIGENDFHQKLSL